MQKSCINCVHESACREIYDTAGLTFDAECPNMDELCLHFMDKELTVSIPCRVGTRVYSAIGFNGKPEKAEPYDVVEITISHGDHVVVVIEDQLGFQRSIAQSNIGKIIFLTEKEAMAKYNELVEEYSKCKVAIGDKLYILSSDSLTGIEETVCTSIKKRVLQDVGEVFVYLAPSAYEECCGATWQFFDWDFDNRVFKSRDAAEEKLKECRKDG